MENDAKRWMTVATLQITASEDGSLADDGCPEAPRAHIVV
jgi:hypothetical protein